MFQCPEFHLQLKERQAQRTAGSNFKILVILTQGFVFPLQEYLRYSNAEFWYHIQGVHNHIHRLIKNCHQSYRGWYCFWANYIPEWLEKKKSFYKYREYSDEHLCPCLPPEVKNGVPSLKATKKEEDAPSFEPTLRTRCCCLSLSSLKESYNVYTVTTNLLGVQSCQPQHAVTATQRSSTSILHRSCVTGTVRAASPSRQ